MGDELSDFDDTAFDNLVNEMWEKQKNERIQNLRDNVSHIISVSQFN